MSWGANEKQDDPGLSAKDVWRTLTGLFFFLAITGNAVAATTDTTHQPWPAIRFAVSTLFLVTLVGWLGLAARDRLSARRDRGRQQGDAA